MRVCPVCQTVNTDEAVRCVNCQNPLAIPVAVIGPAVGAAGYPGAPEAKNYGAPEYELGTQIEQTHAAPRLTPGTMIGKNRYQIVRVVALGGMGAVYQGIDQHLQRPCAIKEMLDSFTEQKDREQAVEWFRREASLLHDLNHQAIPRVRDSFEENNRYYLVMDFVQGRNLAQVLDEDGPHGLPEPRVRNWASQICEVLSYLHHQNIIFRDLKPANVMVGIDDRVRLIDFGIARYLRAQNESTVIVTFGFAAPEQMQGHPERASDIYSLGATLHRLLTHHDPAQNKPTVFDFPMIRSFRPDVTPQFEQIIMRALMPRPFDRWQTAGAMNRAIQALPPYIPPTQLITPNSGMVTTMTPSRSISRPLQRAEEAIIQSRQALDAGHWQEAMKYARRAVDNDKQNAQTHKMLGLVFARSQPPDPNRALQAYTESLRITPNDFETHRLIGDVYLFLLRKPLEAMTAYQQSLQINPTDFEAHRLLGMCLEQTQQDELARQHFAEAVRLAPQYVPAHMAYGQLALRLGRLKDAELAFVTALRLNNALPVARHLLAQVYERQGRMQEALREAEYAIQVDPRDQNAQATLQRLRKAARDTHNFTRPAN